MLADGKMQLELSFLGPSSVVWDGTPVPFPSTTARALLAYLAAEASQFHAREHVAALFWPDQGQAAAFANLRQTLSRLRKALPDPAIATNVLEVTPQTLRLNHNGVQVDVTRFLALLAECQRHAHARLLSCELCIARLHEAVALYRGELLQGLFLETSEAFEEWLTLKRQELQREMMTALDTLACAAEEVGDYAQMCRMARRQLVLEPWHEAAHRQLMWGLALSGDRTGALAQYEACCEVLAVELGIEPTPETHAVAARIRANTLKPQTPPQVAPPVSTALPNLPLQLTPFVGRDEDLAALATRLAQPDVRLVTLVGAGGMGKTRLAIEVAQVRQDLYTDGAFFVALAPLSEVSAIWPAIAAAIGLPVLGDSETALLRVLRDKQLLLVLDNFEHLISGARLVVKLLEAAPRVQVLVTSRTRLQVRGEHLYTVEGMRYAPGAALAEAASASAVRLFVQSARRVQPDFDLSVANVAHVQRICQLVQGMPLGLELAAAWVQTLLPTEIADEIERSAEFLTVDWQDAPERQRSIRGVFEWSWRLLSATEREVFRRLAVFRGGFNRAGAERVAVASLPVLASLVHKSLLRRTEAGDTREARFEIHELLRQYAELELGGSPVELQAVEARHCAFYLQYLAAREPRLTGGEPREAAAEIHAEIDNIRQAWSWAARNQQIEALDTSAVALWQYYWITGLSSEGAAAFEQAATNVEAGLGQGGDTTLADHRRRLLSKLLALHAFMLIHTTEYDAAIANAQRATTLGQHSAGLEGETIAAFVVGEAYYRKGQRQEARTQMIRAIELARRYQQLQPGLEALSDIEWHAHVWLRGIELSLGDYIAARENGQRALQICQERGKLLGEVHSLCNLADIAREMRDYPAARQGYERALRLAPRAGYRWGEGVIRVEMGEIVRYQGNYGLAYKLMEESLVIFREIGDFVQEAIAYMCLGRLSTYLGHYAAARRWFEHLRRIGDLIDAPEMHVEGLLPQALFALRTGDAAQARLYAEEAVHLAATYSSRFMQAHVSVMLGHVYTGLHQLHAAEEAYRSALGRYDALGHAPLATEPRAGLARIALLQGNTTQAAAHVEAILPVLQTHTQVGLDEPFDVYQTCIKVLTAANDPRAPAVMQSADRLLTWYAEQIGDHHLRHMFLENVPSHREIAHAARTLAVR